MQIHELKVKAKKTRKRVGRGGKRGTYSGRGMNGQKSRSGGNVDPLFAGGQTSLIEKLKKTRGFKAISPKKNVVSLDTLEKNFKDGDVISTEALLKAGLIQKSKAKNGTKILGTGSIKKKITTDKDTFVSESAKKAIEKAGGKVGYVQKTVVKKMEKRKLSKKPIKKVSKKK
jgi:large subunit ribosomal protein L15